MQAFFHTQLTNKLRALGYIIEKTQDAWEIKGVSRSIIERFSERTRIIEQISKTKNITNAKEKATIGAKSRVSKNQSVPESELINVWKSQLTAKELAEFQQIKNTAHKETAPFITIASAIDRSLEHFLERVSVVEEKRVLAHAMELCFGNGYAPKDFEKELNQRENILKATENHLDLITTKEMVQLENNLIFKVVQAKGKYPPLHPEYTLQRDFLNKDQKKATLDILSSNDGVIALEGKAGAGKTTMLQELADGLKEVHTQMIAIAPSSKAVDVLKQEGFDKANTIASFLIKPDLQEAIRNQVICVDEASMCGIPTLSKILDIASKKNARVILSGNIRQHSSPGEFGDALRILQEQAQIKTVHLQQNMRQKDAPEYKEAVDFIARGKTIQGYQIIDKKMKAVIEIPEHDKRIETIAEHYIQSTNNNQSSLIISPTNAEKDAISELVRDKLKEQGSITGIPRLFDNLQNLSFTESQKKNPHNYKEGQVIRFIRNTKGGFKAGKHYQVISNTTDSKTTDIKVRDMDTNQALILPHLTPKQYSVYKKATIELAKGDLIKPTVNLKSKQGTKINNGTPKQVKGFAKNGDILLENGKTLARNCYHLTHNYVSTSHGAQGATVKNIYISMTDASLGAVNQQSLYVAVSRGKSQIKLFTDNKTALKSAIARSGERKTANEIAKQQHIKLMERQQREHHKILTLKNNDYAKKRTVQKQQSITRGIS
ncbi:conserved hypothetical protein [Tenacibaculum litopenaei]